MTGGASGIGLGMADALAEAGAHVVIWDRNEGAFQQAQERLERHDRRVFLQAVDVSQSSAVERAMNSVVQQLGRVDAVFANAGFARAAPFLDMTEQSYSEVLATNLDGALWTFRAACRHMVERALKGDPGGSLVATSSLAALDGAAGNISYGAAKGGLLSAMRALAVEFAPHGIRANAILPGWTHTPLMADQKQRFDAIAARRIPMRRLGRSEDFGGIAVYLASSASSYHTGDMFRIDGGYSVF